MAGVYDDLAEAGKVIHHQDDVLNILVNLEKLTEDDRTKAIRTVEDVLAKEFANEPGHAHHGYVSTAAKAV